MNRQSRAWVTACFTISSLLFTAAGFVVQTKQVSENVADSATLDIFANPEGQPLSLTVDPGVEPDLVDARAEIDFDDDITGLGFAQETSSEFRGDPQLLTGTVVDSTIASTFLSTAAARAPPHDLAS